MRTIKNDFLVIKIDEKGATLQSIQDAQGKEYLWQGDPKYWEDRAPNLFPYIGRFTEGKYCLDGQNYEMDIHGFAKDMMFEFAQDSDREISFWLKDNEETKRQYPYAFEFGVTYTLHENKLSVLYIVKNKSNRIMYFGVGAHPGFFVPMEDGLAFEDYYLEFNKTAPVKRVGFSEDCFVNGEYEDFMLEEGVRLPLTHDMFDDDAIVLTDMSRTVTLKSDKGSKAVRVEYPDMKYLGIWHWPKKDAPYVCIEPWSSLPSRKDIVEDLSTKPSLLSLEAGKEYKNQIEIIFE